MTSPLDSERVSYSVRVARDLRTLTRQHQRLVVSRERARQIEDPAKRTQEKRVPACRRPMFNESLGRFARCQAFDAPAL